MLVGVTNILLTDPTVTQGSFQVDVRCESVDVNGVVLHDLTDFFIPEGSQLERNSCATQDALTGRLHFGFTREEIRDVFDADTVAWSQLRLRVSMRLAAGDRVTDWVSLGVLLPETPSLMADQTPLLFAVDCHDVIHGLAEPTNGTLGIAGGTPVGQAIDSLFNIETLAGSPSAKPLQLQRDFALQAISVPLKSDRQWIIDENTTWLLIIDQLLESAGWLPPWVNRDGVLTSAPWVAPSPGAQIELVLDDDPRTSVVALGAANKIDTYGVPNLFTYIATDFDPDATDTPVEGNGITTRANLDVGPSSQQARGRVIASVVRVDAVDQASLEAIADRDFLASVTPAKTLCLEVAPQPLPWHRGIVEVTINDLGIVGERFMVREWSMPLDGGDCRIVLDGISDVGED